jgi:isoquinoline 1-oxidoreductase beta subunit
MIPSPTNSPSRRAVLSAGAVAAASLVVEFHIPARAAAPPAHPVLPNAFIAVAPDGAVTFQIPQTEMGQGVYTSLSQLLAEELDVSLDHVTPLPAPPNDSLYGIPAMGMMITGGSMSVRGFYLPLRRAGASARAMLVTAAARRWQVPESGLRTEKGQVIDDAHGRRIAYGALAAAASRLSPPQDPPLKPESRFNLIGKSLHRLDTPAKVNGTAQYGIDVRMPGLRVVAFIYAPVLGAKVAAVDSKALEGRSGLELVVLDDIVAVAGPHYWAAKRALADLKIRWDAGANAAVDSAMIESELAAAANRKGAVAKTLGDPDRALARGSRLDATYELPFLAHAAMEPLNFTVHVRADGCEMWGGSQVQTGAVRAAARVLGMAPEKIVFHNFMLGGGFGRRLDTDMVVKAVRIAQKLKGPVKVMWSREDDIAQDVFRPAYRNLVSASLDTQGRIDGWNHRIAAGSVMVRWLGAPLKNGLDPSSVDGALDNIYGARNFRVEYSEAEPPGMTIGFWRGVAPNNAIFAIESMMDELALKAGQDPVAFRLAHLDHAPRLKAVLKLAAEKSGWGSPLGRRRGRGVVAQFVFGSFIAAVADVEVDDTGEIRIHRYTAAVDAGRVVNPDGLAAQLQGGLIFGATAALYGRIDIRGGRIQQSNFHDYRMMRINEAPAIDVHIMPSSADPGGIGEPGCTAAIPALVNAIAAATGVRLRKMPIDRKALAVRKSV